MRSSIALVVLFLTCLAAPSSVVDGVSVSGGHLLRGGTARDVTPRAGVFDPAHSATIDSHDPRGGGLPPPNTIGVDPSKIHVLSESEPRAYVYRGFLRPSECDYIVQSSTNGMAKSTVVDNNTGKSVPSTIRTSDGTFIGRGADSVISDIERRISEWSHVPVENGEGLQVLRYKDGQRYDAHMDAFSDSFNQDEKKGGQRVATVLMYLSDVAEGGETVFPLTTQKPHLLNSNYSACARRGVAVKPRKGDALLFWSLDTSGTLDQKSTHAGCPVLGSSVKWSATKWMHVGAVSSGHKMAFPSGTCDDENDQCTTWAQQGECEKNRAYMVGVAGEDGHCTRACLKCPVGSRPKDSSR